MNDATYPATGVRQLTKLYADERPYWQRWYKDSYAAAAVGCGHLHTTEKGAERCKGRSKMPVR